MIPDGGLHAVHFGSPNLIMARNVPYDVPRRQELAVDDSQGIDAALGKGQGYMSSQHASPKKDSTASFENLRVGSSSEPESPLVIQFGY